MDPLRTEARRRALPGPFLLAHQEQPHSREARRTDGGRKETTGAPFIADLPTSDLCDWRTQTPFSESPGPCQSL